MYVCLVWLLSWEAYDKLLNCVWWLKYLKWNVVLLNGDSKLNCFRDKVLKWSVCGVMIDFWVFWEDLLVLQYYDFDWYLKCFKMEFLFCKNWYLELNFENNGCFGFNLWTMRILSYIENDDLIWKYEIYELYWKNVDLYWNWCCGRPLVKCANVGVIRLVNV